MSRGGAVKFGFPTLLLGSYQLAGPLLLEVKKGTSCLYSFHIGLRGGIGLGSEKPATTKITSSFVTACAPQGQAERRKIRRCGLQKLATILFSIAAAGTDDRALRPPARANRAPVADPATPLPGHATAFEAFEALEIANHLVQPGCVPHPTRGPALLNQEPAIVSILPALIPRQ